MELLWSRSGAGEPMLFKLTVIQHPAKSLACNSTTPSGYMRRHGDNLHIQYAARKLVAAPNLNQKRISLLKKL